MDGQYVVNVVTDPYYRFSLPISRNAHPLTSPMWGQGVLCSNREKRKISLLQTPLIRVQISIKADLNNDKNLLTPQPTPTTRS